MTATLSSQLPPRVVGNPIGGFMRAWGEDPLAVLERVRAEGGDVARMHFGLGFHSLQLSHPDAVRQVLQENQTNYQKGFDYQRMEPLVGKGLLTLNGEEWKRHRRIAQPAFLKQRVLGFGAAMVRRTEVMLERWRRLGDGAWLDVHAEMNRLTLEIVGDALFTTDLSAHTADIGRALTGAIHTTNLRINRVWPLPLWLPTPENLRYRRDIAVLDAAVRGIIEERRRHGAGDDLLGMLMQARDEGSADMALDDRALRDEVMTLILAGHETTANALTFTLMLLSRHPEVRQRLEREVAEVLGGRRPASADYGALGYVRQVAEEAMRLFPPAWLLGRTAVADDEVMGYRVSRGALILLPIWLIHRDARFWPDPLRFDPTRFSPGQVEGRHRFAYFPFGGGPRLCIGQGFAMLELTLILAALAQAARVEVEAPDPVALEPVITLRPRGGMPGRLRLR